MLKVDNNDILTNEKESIFILFWITFLEILRPSQNNFLIKKSPTRETQR
jgi:hypothetical protein